MQGFAEITAAVLNACGSSPDSREQFTSMQSSVCMCGPSQRLPGTRIPIGDVDVDNGPSPLLRRTAKRQPS